MNAADIDCLQQLFVKAKRWQIVSDNNDVCQLFDNCDMALFKSPLNVNHCLRHLYPDNRHDVHSMTCDHVVIIVRFLNAGCKVQETHSLIVYRLHMCNVHFMFFFNFLKFYMYICKLQ